MEAGVYGAPLERVAQYRMPMISGYTTGRIYVRLALQTSGNPTSNPVVSYDTVNAVFANDSSVAGGTVQLYQTDDLASGPRTALGSAVALVALGQNTIQFTPLAHYVEFKCIGGGPFELRAQFASQLTSNLQGFSKLDTLYPQYIVAGQVTPLLPTLTQIPSAFFP